MRYYPKSMATAILQKIFNEGLSLGPSMAELCVGRFYVKVTFYFYGQDRRDEFDRALRPMTVDGLSQNSHYGSITDCYTLIYTLFLDNESAEAGKH